MLPRQCLEDLEYWANTDWRIVPRILRLMAECLRDPFRGTGKPEPLKRLGPNLWSRRITSVDRLVYRVEAEQIVFLRARSHYE